MSEVAAGRRSSSSGRRRSSTAQRGRAEPPPDDETPDADPVAVARLIALRKLAAAPRSRQELARAMAQRGVADEVAEVVLDRLESQRLVDDAEYARIVVTSRREHKGLSRSALARELRTRGVDDEIARDALSGLDEDDELATAIDLVRRKARSMSGDDPIRRQRRLLGMLARKGFSGSLSSRAIREALGELEALHADDQS